MTHFTTSYYLPCNQYTLFAEGLFNNKGKLSEGEHDQIRRIKLVIYEGFKKAIEKGLPRENAVIIVDELLGEQVLINAQKEGYRVINDQQELKRNDANIIVFDTKIFWHPIIEFFKGHIDGYAAAVSISDNIIEQYSRLISTNTNIVLEKKI